IDMRFLWEEVRPDYDVRWEEARQMLLVASRRHLQRTPEEDWPVWAGIGLGETWTFESHPSNEAREYPKGRARRAMPRATLFRPGSFEVRCRAGRPLVMCVVLGDEAQAVRQRVTRVLERREAKIVARHARLQALLDRPGLEASDPRLERAAAWCRLSLDQLIMEQRGLGIYAGFPWFTTYWGRDSFIALPGACLVTGDFETARTILRTFAVHQIDDAQSLHEGRLPNFVTVKQVQYATADGTWWWVRALRQYEEASGDLGFAEGLYPVVQRALNGALTHRVDPTGFIRHGDGETWMDAGGEAHPYSPRGDRAVEVQGLFLNALGYGVHLARRMRERGDALRWQEAETRLGRGFAERFFDPQTGSPRDHLNADDSADTQVRPNGLLAWFAAPHRFRHDMARATIEQVRDRLTYPWGVGSLASDDPQFHPWHLALEQYYYDEAYHNGDVWLWLAGPLVSGLVSLHQVEAAWQQTAFLAGEILERGVAGSLREIRDAVESAAKDEFGGACAQAWSLSEFQRTLYEDYLGVRPQMSSGRITVAPLLPAGLSRLSARVPVGSGGMRVLHERKPGVLRTTLEPDSGCAGAVARVVLTSADGTRHAVEIPLEPGHTSEVTLDDRSHEFSVDGNAVPPSQRLELPSLPPRDAPGFRFRPPASTAGR
ncbi:MAG: amylo-alpha-1,6-glucosidase, partial [Candidatus Krumholzibacteriia bacterium]